MSTKVDDFRFEENEDDVKELIASCEASEMSEYSVCDKCKLQVDCCVYFAWKEKNIKNPCKIISDLQSSLEKAREENEELQSQLKSLRATIGINATRENNITSLHQQISDLKKQRIQWVSVKDKMPKSPQDYLCFNENSGIFQAHTWSKANGFWLNDGLNEIQMKVTHWAEINLPEVKEDCK